MSARKWMVVGFAVAGLAAVGAAGAIGDRDGQAPSMGGMASGGMGRTGGMGGMHVSSEFGYLSEMIPHHEEAIAAAKVLEAGTDRAEMRRFARDIVRTQSAEVRTMKRWLARWYPGRDTSVDYEPMMRDLRGLQGDALDRRFLEDMIPHHMMAVMMSQQLLARDLAEHRDVGPFARNIRDVQRLEIQMMRGWLRSWFGVAGGHGGMGMGGHGGMGRGMQ